MCGSGGLYGLAMLIKRATLVLSLLTASTAVGPAVLSCIAAEARSRPLKLPGLRLLDPYKEQAEQGEQAKIEKKLDIAHQSFAVPQRTEPSNSPQNVVNYAPGSDPSRYLPGSTVESFNQAGALAIGKVLIKPSGAVSYGYESNLLALSSGHQPDRALTVAPTIEVFIPLTQDGIRFEYSMLYRNYNRYKLTQNFDHVFNADSEFYLSPLVTLAFRDHFSMSSVNALEYMPGRELIFSDSRFKRNDFGLRMNYTVSQNDSLSFAAGWNHVFFDQSAQDKSTPFYNYDQYRFEGTYRRDVSERLGVFATGIYNQNSTRDPRNLANSKGFSIMSGIDGSLTPLIRAQIGVGANVERYPGALRSSVTGLVFRGNVSKEISERSQISFSMSRESNISNFQQNPYFVTTGTGIAYTREVRANLGFHLAAGYQHNGYPLPLQAGDGVPIDLVGRRNRADDFVDMGLGALYRFNEWLAMDVRFDLTRRYSDIPQYCFHSYRGIVSFLIGSRGSASRTPY